MLNVYVLPKSRNRWMRASNQNNWTCFLDFGEDKSLVAPTHLTSSDEEVATISFSDNEGKAKGRGIPARELV